MKTVLILLFCSLATGAIKAQNIPSLKPNGKTYPAAGLKIGDQCPDFQIGNIKNYKSAAARLSDFKGRLVILDFWATWCGPCLKALPKLDSLQKRYPGKIQVLAVTNESNAVVNRFFSNTPDRELRKLTLPIVFNDVLLNGLFKHKTIPHEVWIDGNGTVRFFTDADDVDIKNIDAFLNRQQVTMQVKSELQYNKLKPLLMGGADSALIDLQFSSVITSYIKGLPSPRGYTKTGNLHKIYNNNALIQNLYKMAFGGFNPYFFAYNRSRLEVKDSTSLYYYWTGRKMDKALKDSLLKKSAFCYELTVPQSIPEDRMFEIMQFDLNKFFGAKFGIEGGMEKRKVKCLVAKRIGPEDRLRSKGDTTFIDADAFRFRIRNKSIDLFFKNLAGLYLQDIPTPIVNETGYNDNVDMDINAHLNNLEEVREQMRKYGMDFFEEEREIDMIIIRDKAVKY